MSRRNRSARRYTDSDIEKAIKMADTYELEELRTMAQRFVLHDRIFTYAIAIAMAVTMWVSHAQQTILELPSFRGTVQVPVGIVMLCMVYLILIVRHGRISEGLTIVIAYRIKERRAEEKKTTEDQDAPV